MQSLYNGHINLVTLFLFVALICVHEIIMDGQSFKSYKWNLHSALNT